MEKKTIANKIVKCKNIKCREIIFWLKKTEIKHRLMMNSKYLLFK